MMQMSHEQIHKTSQNKLSRFASKSFSFSDIKVYVTDKSTVSVLACDSFEDGRKALFEKKMKPVTAKHFI